MNTFDPPRSSRIKPVAEIDAFKIDTGILYRQGMLSISDEARSGIYTDPKQANHNNTLHYTARILSKADARIEFVFQESDTSMSQVIQLSCRNGIHNSPIWNFYCPQCGKPFRKLFMMNRSIACRNCHDLTYFTQRISGRQSLFCLLGHDRLSRLYPYYLKKANIVKLVNVLYYTVIIKRRLTKANSLFLEWHGNRHLDTPDQDRLLKEIDRLNKKTQSIFEKSENLYLKRFGQEKINDEKTAS